MISVSSKKVSLQIAQVSFPGSDRYLEVVDMALLPWRFKKLVILRAFDIGFNSTVSIGSDLSGAAMFGSQTSLLFEAILLLIVTGSSISFFLISFFLICVTEVSLSEYETTLVLFSRTKPSSNLPS